MTFNISSSNFDNDDFELDEDSSGDLVLTHKDSGATFKYDSSESVWIPSGGLGSANNPVSSIHSDSLSTERAGITEDITQKTEREPGALAASHGDASDYWEYKPNQVGERTITNIFPVARGSGISVNGDGSWKGVGPNWAVPAFFCPAGKMLHLGLVFDGIQQTGSEWQYRLQETVEDETILSGVLDGGSSNNRIYRETSLYDSVYGGAAFHSWPRPQLQLKGPSGSATAYQTTNLVVIEEVI